MFRILFLAVGIGVSSTWAADLAPDALSNHIFRYRYTSVVGATIQERGAILLTANGNASELYVESAGRITSYSAPREGTYTYDKTGPNTATLSLQFGAQQIQRQLLFTTPESGSWPNEGRAILGASFTLSSIKQPTPLANASSRCVVSADQPGILGFIVGGERERDVLVRVVGPGLALFNVPQPVQQPALSLFWGENRLFPKEGWGSNAFNAMPRETFARAFALVGAFPLDPALQDVAVLTTLHPGAYTVHASSAQAGSVLMEVYILP